MFLYAFAFACTIYAIFQNLDESDLPVISQATCPQASKSFVTQNLGCHRYI